jgi:polyphosphate glucokinase
MTKKEAPSKAGARRTRKAVASVEASPTSILTIDVGGTNVKFLATGHTEPRSFRSGKSLTPKAMVEQVVADAADWRYDAVSIGIPGLVGTEGLRSEPGNLAPGWVGFNFAAAFDHPVRIINDAAMQALGSYEGGRMLFLGLGTGIGSALIVDNVIVPMELGALKDGSGEDVGLALGRQGLKRMGKKAWRKRVADLVVMLSRAFNVDYIMIGGGNSKHLRQLPHGTRRGHNLTAFRGGSRLWLLEDVQTLSAEDHHEAQSPPRPAEWRVL